jgi:hypothetical protein
LNDITDVNAKLLEAYFHLTPSDLNTFDFRDIILIDNAYWRVNRIEDYNPNAIDRTTKVVLYKLNQLDIFYNDNSTVPSSEIDCPDDVYIKKTKYGWIFVSPSNQVITEDCCLLWGGYWTNGYCQAKKPIINNPGEPWGVQTGYPQTGSGIAPSFQARVGAIGENRPFEMNKNQNIINSNTVIVKGTSNFVDSSAENVLVMGDGNSVNENTRNALIIGNDHNSIESDTIVVGNLVLNSDGFRWYYPTITEAGYETVMYVGKTNLIDIIDGTYPPMLLTIQFKKTMLNEQDIIVINEIEKGKRVNDIDNASSEATYKRLQRIRKKIGMPITIMLKYLKLDTFLSNDNSQNK